jgi:hypothetical protein
MRTTLSEVHGYQRSLEKYSNIIMGVRFLHTLWTSIDTMGEEKTMDLIAGRIVQHIKEIGERRQGLWCVYGWVVQGCFRTYPERVSLTVVLRVSDTWDGWLFEQRWTRGPTRTLKRSSRILPKHLGLYLQHYFYILSSKKFAYRIFRTSPDT